ncbi:MAG: transcription termination factor Rho, partial [Firmicutes bacterium]|nr:transcription termination factor Rho [Bacillota bacterium]
MGSSEAEGVFELCPDGYGFLRAENYECTSKDVFVARPLVKQYGLRKGDYVVGTCAKMRDTGAAALKFVYSINGENIMDVGKTV